MPQSHSLYTIEPKSPTITTSKIISRITSLPKNTFADTFIFFISQLQHFFLLLWLQFHLNPLDNNNHTPLSYYITQITDAVLLQKITTAIHGDGFYSFLLIISWLYMIFLLASCLYIALKNHKTTPPNKFLGFAFHLHLSLIFVFINILLLSSELTNLKFLGITTDINEQRIALRIINSIFVVLNYLITAALALFHFVPFKSQGNLAVRSSASQCLLLLSKAVASPFVGSIGSQSQGVCIVITVTILALSIIQLYLLIKSVPLFNYKIMRLAVISGQISLLISLTNGIIAIFDVTPAKTNTLLFIELLTIPITTKFTLNYFEKCLMYYANTQYMNSENQVFKKLLGLIAMEESAKFSINNHLNPNLSEVYIMGQLARHSRTCSDINCICNSLISQQYIPEISQVREALNSYIYQENCNILKEAIENIPHAYELRLYLVSMILAQKNSQLKSISSLLLNVIRTGSSLFLSMKKSVLLQEIQARLHSVFSERQGNILDMESFVNFHNDKCHFISLLCSNTKKFHDFWAYYKQPNFFIKQLLNKSQVFDFETERISLYWDHYVRKYKDIFTNNTAGHYCSYLSLVRNVPSKALKINRKYENHHHHHSSSKSRSTITQETLNLPDTVVLYLTMTHDKKNIIRYVSKNISKNLIYKPEDLIGRSINALLPPSLAKSYTNNVLLNYFQGGSSSNYHENNEYMKTKKGFILPCSLYLTIYPYIQEELTYMIMLRTTPNHSYELILLTAEGLIDGFSEGIATSLNLKSDSNLHISDIYQDNKKLMVSQRTVASRTRYTTTKISSLEEETQSSQTEHQGSPFHNYNKEILRKITQEEERWIDVEFVKQGAWVVDNKFQRYVVRVITKDLGGQKYYALIIRNPERALSSLARNSYKTDLTERRKSLSTRYHEKTFENDEITLQGEEDLNEFPTKKGRFSLMESPNILIPDSLRANLLSTNTRETPQILDTLQPKDSNREELHHHDEIITNEPESPFEHVGSPRRRLHLQKARSDKASSVHSNTSSSKLEKAVHTLPPNTLVKRTKIAVYVFTVICLGIQILVSLHENHNLSLIEINVLNLKLFALRLVQIILLVNDVQALQLLQSGFIDDDSLAEFGVVSLEDSLLNKVQADQFSLNTLNYGLRDSLDQVDRSLQAAFYNKSVPITFQSALQDDDHVNTFDMVTEIVMKAQKIIGVHNLSETAAEDINFITSNSLNELLVHSEFIDDLLLEDNRIKFNKNIFLSLLTLGILVAISIIGMISLVIQQKLLVKDRNQLINLFLYTDEKVISQVLAKVKILQELMSQDNSPNNLSEKKKESSWNFEYEHQKTIRQRQANKKGINYNHILIFVLSFFIAFALIFPFILLSADSESDNNDLNKKIEALDQAYNNFYDANLILTTFYVYIANNGTGNVRMNPLEEEWQIQYQDLKNSQGFLFGLLSSIQNKGDAKESTIKTLHQLVYDNLCIETNLTSKENRGFCQSLGHGVIETGLQGINNYFLYNIKALYDQFRYSNRSVEAARSVLNSRELAELNFIGRVWQSEAYIQFAQELENYFTEVMQKQQWNDQMFLGFYYAFEVVIVIVLMRFMQRKIEEERLGWRKMLRTIPNELVCSSKIMKNYLAHENSHLVTWNY